MNDIVLDWPAYFKAFCAVHGEPVEWKGRLIFPDGWAYSKTDYSGPEYPPPASAEELRQLLLHYWEKRYSMVSQEAQELKAQLDSLRKAQQVRSAPLQRVAYSGLDENGRSILERGKLDLEPLRARLEWLALDAVDCLKQIETLRGPSDESLLAS